MTRLAALLVVLGCGRGGDSPRAGSSVATGSTAPPPAAPIACTELAFAESTPVPEASGAAWLDVAGKPSLLVISDSGNDGAYTIVDAETGQTIEQGKLPLGGAGEDLEGIAVRGGKFHVITSPGWIRVYERAGQGFQLVDGPYAVGPERGGMVCATTNCGRNYEGLCLAPEPVAGRCVGFAASKADGALYCLVDQAGRLAIERAGAIAIAGSGRVADCAFSDDGRLYVGSNLFDLGNVYRVDGWQTPPSAVVTRIAAIGVGFPETLAVRGDVFYRMSDTGGAPSLMKKYRCR